MSQFKKLASWEIHRGILRGPQSVGRHSFVEKGEVNHGYLEAWNHALDHENNTLCNRLEIEAEIV